ncbi:MAG: cytochrome c peroxidase [Spirosomataceae bacterium]
MRYFIGLTALLFFLSSFLSETKQKKRELHPYPFVYPTSFGSRFTIPADNPTTEEGVALGRMLFYEPLLSNTNIVSCSSCHAQVNAFTDGLPLSVGVSGKFTRRNSMSLANLLWVKNLFWDGRANGLENQAAFPLTHPDEMGQSLEASAAKLTKTRRYPPLFREVFGTSTITGDLITKALAQFERTLISADSPYDRSLKGEYRLSAAEQRGLDLFMRGPAPERGVRGGNCAHCHGGAKLFQEVFHNNGLDSIAVSDKGRQETTGDVSDNGRFRVATLRNIELTAPYMHDGRFANLEQVLDHYNEHFHFSPNLSHELRTAHNDAAGQRLGLTSSEKKDIIAFLHTLTDSAFITNPAFSNPFKKGKQLIR